MFLSALQGTVSKSCQSARAQASHNSQEWDAVNNEQLGKLHGVMQSLMST